ncbi:SIMPL domain-containing protein [Aequorivita viscosa]|nr:SIMPL domain-containing protein [Aequorivita viscosa]
MKTKITAICILLVQMGFAQISGNQIYGNTNNQYQNVGLQLSNNPKKVLLTNESMQFNVNLLKNVKATSFVITLGLNEEGSTVKICNSKINQRISGFKNAIKSLGIHEQDMYVDFITQTKVYGYVTEKNQNQTKINQVEGGFEIKKNIILKVDDILIFDRLVEIASEYDIHNIIKVTYHSSEIDAIYNELLENAMKIVANRKKLLPHKNSDWETNPILNIEFHNIQPAVQYKKFQAFETSDISYLNNYYRSNEVVLKEELRKSNSFYYNSLPTDNFDKITNADTPVVGLQFVMQVSVTYKKKAQEEPKKEIYIITPNGELKLVDLKKVV